MSAPFRGLSCNERNCKLGERKSCQKTGLVSIGLALPPPKALLGLRSRVELLQLSSRVSFLYRLYQTRNLLQSEGCRLRRPVQQESSIPLVGIYIAHSARFSAIVMQCLLRLWPRTRRLFVRCPHHRASLQLRRHLHRSNRSPMCTTRTL